jgi:hypothetical protein
MCIFLIEIHMIQTRNTVRMSRSRLWPNCTLQVPQRRRDPTVRESPNLLYMQGLYGNAQGDRSRPTDRDDRQSLCEE